MVTNRKVQGLALSMPSGLALGVVISLILTLVSSTLISYMVLSERMAEGAIGYGVMVSVLLSSGCGALAASLRIKRRRLVVCMASGTCYYLMLLCITALFFGGQYQGMGVTALLVLAGSGSAALLGNKGEGKSSKKLKKRRHR